jgi:predicted Ser/Thr protein kinase
MMDPADNPVIIDFDSCTIGEGVKIVKGFTMGWSLPDSESGVRENDFYGLKKLEEFLSEPIGEKTEMDMEDREANGE